jgi:hypothetical protein
MQKSGRSRYRRSQKNDENVIQLRGSRVNFLDMKAGSEILVNVDGRSSIGRLDASSGSHFPRPDLTLLGDSVLRVESAELSRVYLTENAQLSLLEDAGPISILGSGKVEVWRSANGLKFDGTALSLHMMRYSQVIEAAGSVRLYSGPHARLTGRAAGGSFQRNALKLREINDEPGAVTGMSLINFSVPVSLQGIQMLNIIKENAILATPLLHNGLPGMRDTLKSRAHRCWVARRRLRPRKVEALEMDYASAISGLSHIGNSPASVRTKLAWCTYRIRQLQTTGKAERSILATYRLLGYGERPMPAFILYFAVALLMAMLSLSDESVTLTISGIKHFLTVVTGWLVSPLHLLNLTEDKDSIVHFNQPWDTFARLLIAAPFATGLLALRKYVKDEKPG